MEELRKNHNLIKRTLIEDVTREGDAILDVGAGFGGDLQKWRDQGAHINMCDPDHSALEEAKKRARNMKINVNFYEGDIFKCPHRKFDIICYNFSLHYIFKTEKLFHESLKEIRERMKPGGKLIGIIPDSETLLFRTPYTDVIGNYFLLERNAGYGQFGERLIVHLEDTPFYGDSAKVEPIAYKDMLITYLEKLGFQMEMWEGLSGHPISELYSKFIFTYRKRG
ncbi:hypothetical protein [Dishui Lake phycodnavirus 4]|nr:hypothetical protein [Dishui Lake phycodnavirus 4]